MGKKVCLLRIEQCCYYFICTVIVYLYIHTVFGTFIKSIWSVNINNNHHHLTCGCRGNNTPKLTCNVDVI